MGDLVLVGTPRGGVYVAFPAIGVGLWAAAVQLRPQARSQVQLGSEEVVRIFVRLGVGLMKMKEGCAESPRSY